MNSIRMINQTPNARLEYDEVINRIGLMDIRNNNALVRSFFINDNSKDAVIFEGLKVSNINNLDVYLTTPVVVVQHINGKDVKSVIEYNKGQGIRLTFEPGETGVRRDIIEARIAQRETKKDNLIFVADSRTDTIVTKTGYRDVETYLDIRVKKGVVSADAPMTTAATSAKIESLEFNTSIDLTNEFILCFTIGEDGEFIEVNCQGTSPATTSLPEIILKINGAGFGNIASKSNNKIVITAPGTGENSKIKIRQPVNASQDIYSLLFGGVEPQGYKTIISGENKWFKVAEVIVPVNSASIPVGNVLTAENIGSWTNDRNMVYRSSNFEQLRAGFEIHRSNSDMDHPAFSVKPHHLSQNTSRAMRPIGSICSVDLSFPGVPIPDGCYQNCNGSIINDAESPMFGFRTRNLNGWEVTLNTLSRSDVEKYIKVSDKDSTALLVGDLIFGVGIPDNSYIRGITGIVNGQVSVYLGDLATDELTTGTITGSSGEITIRGRNRFLKGQSTSGQGEMDFNKVHKHESLDHNHGQDVHTHTPESHIHTIPRMEVVKVLSNPTDGDVYCYKFITSGTNNVYTNINVPFNNSEESPNIHASNVELQLDGGSEVTPLNMSIVYFMCIK